MLAEASDRFTLGVASCLFPQPLISDQEFALLEEYGVSSVELSCRHSALALRDPFFADRLRALVQDAGLDVFSLHAPYEPDRDLSSLDEKRRLVAVERAGEALDLASRLGATLVTIHGSQDPILPCQRAARRVQARKSLASLIAKARSLSLLLALEMMPPQWLPAGVTEAFQLVRGLDSEVLGFCLDTNHANLTGDLPEIVRALGGRMWIVHTSDNDGVKQRHWMPFQGVIDWKPLLNALCEVEYSGPLVYELDPHPAGLKQSLQEIRDNFRELRALAYGKE